MASESNLSDNMCMIDFISTEYLHIYFISKPNAEVSLTLEWKLLYFYLRIKLIEFIRESMRKRC